jgi:hypothetical protein
MGLEFKLQSLDAVPEVLRSAYVQKDGAYVLDVNGGLVSESEVKGLKSKNEELLSEKKKLLGQYNELLENHKLTDAQRADLQGKVDDLEKQVLSSDELAAKKIKQAREEAAAETAKIKAQADHYQQLYTTSTIEAVLTRAAQEAGAFSAAQIHGLLAGRTVLEPVIGDDGRPTGQYVPKTTVTVLDGDKRVEKNLPAAEAVKAFLGLPENKNLVDTKFQPGGGATGGRAGATNQNWHDLSPVERLNQARGV